MERSKDTEVDGLTVKIDTEKMPRVVIQIDRDSLRVFTQDDIDRMQEDKN